MTADRWIRGARITGLTIADASIMPTISPATTNLPKIMVAEHIALWLHDVIRRSWLSVRPQPSLRRQRASRSRARPTA